MATSDAEGPGACPASPGWRGWGQWVWASLHTSDFVHLTELPSLSPPLPSLVVGRADIDPWSQCKLPHQSPFSAKEQRHFCLLSRSPQAPTTNPMSLQANPWLFRKVLPHRAALAGRGDSPSVQAQTQIHFPFPSRQVPISGQ